MYFPHTAPTHLNWVSDVQNQQTVTDCRSESQQRLYLQIQLHRHQHTNQFYGIVFYQHWESLNNQSLVFEAIILEEVAIGPSSKRPAALLKAANNTAACPDSFLHHQSNPSYSGHIQKTKWNVCVFYVLIYKYKKFWFFFLMKSKSILLSRNPN